MTQYTSPCANAGTQPDSEIRKKAEAAFFLELWLLTG